jgi:hypothetical protein
VLSGAEFTLQSFYYSVFSALLHAGAWLFPLNTLFSNTFNLSAVGPTLKLKVLENKQTLEAKSLL